MKLGEDGASIIVQLSEHDWKYLKPGCLAFISGIKTMIPSSEREYDDVTKEWRVAKKHRVKIEALRLEFLVDKNQGDLFQ